MKEILCKFLCGESIDKLKNDLYLAEITLVSTKNRLDLLTQTYNETTLHFNDTKKELLEEIKENQLKIKQLSETIIVYKNALLQYSEYVIPSNVMQLIKLYNEKYEHKSIYHNSYMFAKNKNGINMDIRNWITPYDIEITNYCETKKIKTVYQFIKEGNGFHESCDLVVNDFLNSYKPLYKWDYQEFIEFNITDLWQMPFQTKLAWQGDCEDYTNFVISCLNNRGIPAGLTRNACGKTYSGYGHSTTNYLASDTKWKHIESTLSYGKNTDILKLYGIHDEKDTMNIQSIWYSFSHTHSNSSWLSKEQTSTWNEFKRNKYTIIKR
jgi:hypothetical protein